MAIIYSYPKITSLDNNDRFVVSKMDQDNNPTKTVTFGTLASEIAATLGTGDVTGSGTTNYVTQWIDGPNKEIGDSPAFTFDGGAGLKQFILTDGYRFVVDRDAATTVGDPEYAITQNGVNKTSFGWDDDGGGYGFIYNWAGKGFKLGGAALYPHLELLTDPDLKIISFSDFQIAAAGSAASTGSFNLDFKGVDDLGVELVGARMFTTDSTINPSGQDLHIQNASDAGTLGTNIFVDAFGFVGLGTTNPLSNLHVANDATIGTNLSIGEDLTVGENVVFSDYGSGTKTGTSTYNLAVDASGNVIEEASGGGGGAVGSTIDYTLPGNGYEIRFYIENITPGSPDFGQAFAQPQLIAFQRQSAGAATQGGMPFNLFYNKYTPALDPAYDGASGCGGNMCLKPMMEESVADINLLNSGSVNPDFSWQIFTQDAAALSSYRMPLKMRVDNGGASPGNGTLRITLIKSSNSSPNPVDDATVLPSTVSVYFRDTTLTTSTVARPPFNLLWAGSDTQFAQTHNGGAAYTNSLDYVFTGNSAGDIIRKYEIFFQDEYNAYNRCSYLKVTDGRVVFQDLPTSDPVSKGVLWDDAGTLKISQG